VYTIRCCTLLHCTLSTVVHCCIVHYPLLYTGTLYTIRCCTLLYCTLSVVVHCYIVHYQLFYTVTLYTIRCCTLLHRTLSIVHCYIVHYPLLYTVTLYTIRCCTVLHCTLSIVVHCYIVHYPLLYTIHTLHDSNICRTKCNNNNNCDPLGSVSVLCNLGNRPMFVITDYTFRMKQGLCIIIMLLLLCVAVTLAFRRTKYTI